jgi:hypothetical protein
VKPEFTQASDSFKNLNPALFGITIPTPKDKGSRQDLLLEKELQGQIRSILGHKGIVAIQSRMDKRTSNQVGTPDFLFAVDGKAVCWECKLPGGKLSPEQERMKELLAHEPNGWTYRVIHSVDEALAELKNYC